LTTGVLAEEIPITNAVGAISVLFFVLVLAKIV
jgi:hypothetical protein